MTGTDFGPGFDLGEWYRDFAARQRANRERTALDVFHAAKQSGILPEQEARAQSLSRRLNVPRLQLPDAPEKLEELEREADLRELMVRRPNLLRAMQDVPRARMMLDDLGNFKTTADTFDWLERAWSAGRATNEAGLLKVKAVYLGGLHRLSAFERDRLQEIEQLMIGQQEDSDPLWLGSATMFLGQMLEPALASAGAGLTAGALAGPGAPFAGTAASLGVMFMHSALVEFGHQYEETYRQLIDEGISHDEAHRVARNTAAAYGLGAGALEAFSFKILGKPFVKAAQGLTKPGGLLAFTRKGLDKDTAAKAFGTFLREYGAGFGAEVGTEGAQKALAQFSELAAAGIARADIGPEGFGNFLEGVAVEMFEAAKGMLWVSMPGPAIHYAADRQRVQESQVATQMFEKLAEQAAASKTLPRDQQTYAEMITGVVKGKPAENVYIPAKDLARGLEQAGQTRQQLAQDMPEVAEQLQKNEASDDDVVIPMGQFAAYVAPSKLYPAIRDDIRLREDGYSNRRAKEWLAEQEKNRVETQQMIDEESSKVAAWNEEAIEVEARMITELSKDPRLSKEETRSIAMHHRFWVEASAAREKMSPREFDRMHRLDFQVDTGRSEVRAQELEQGRIDTPEFQAWFGESKAVVEQGGDKGQPLELYRGTQKRPKPTKFVTRGGRATPSFTPDIRVASVYSSSPETGRFGPGATVSSVYLSLQKPLDLRDLGETVSLWDVVQKTNWDLTDDPEQGAVGYLDIATALRDLDTMAARTGARFEISGAAPESIFRIQSFDELADAIEQLGEDGKGEEIEALLDSTQVDAYLLADSQFFVDFLRDAGFDGMIIKDVFDVGAERMTPEERATLEEGWEGGYVVDTYRPFDQTQIKSKFNRGTFDPDDPNILAQEAVTGARAKDALLERALGRARPDATLSLVGATAIARGEEFPTRRDFKVRLQEVATRALEEAGLSLESDTPELREYLHRVLASDAKTALAQNENAIGWYDVKTRQALAIVARMHPEIAKDWRARFAFVYALAVTSNGQKVNRNFELAELVYRHWRKHKEMPTNIGEGKSADTMKRSLALYNQLIKRFGVERLFRFMISEFTVGDILALDSTIKVSGELAETTVLGAALLGPKIGNGFFANLFGMFDQLTMDRWLVRTWGRWTGTLFKDMPEQTARAKDRMLAAMAELTDEDAARLSAIYRVEDVRQLPPAELSDLTKKVSEKPENRAVMNETSSGEELRKAGNSYWAYRDGQKEDPADGTERNRIRAVFQGVLAELRQDAKWQDLTMADLQAVLWYSEKRLYEVATEEVDDGVAEGYDDDSAPDYANAAARLALANGVTQKQIDNTLAKEAQSGRAGTTGPGAPTAEAGVGGGAPATAAAPRPLTARQRRTLLGHLATETTRRRSAGSARAADWRYTRRSVTDDRGRRLLEGQGPQLEISSQRIDPVAVWEPGQHIKRLLAKAGHPTPSFYELRGGDKGSARAFENALEHAKTTHPYGAAVFVYEEEAYLQMRLFLTPDGKSGFALKRDGDIVSGFSIENAGRAMVDTAIRAGGRKADCFDTQLPHLYAAHGFKVVAREKWNEDYKPKDWDKKAFAKFNNGEPDVVHLVLDPDHYAFYLPGEGLYRDGPTAQTRALRNLQGDAEPQRELIVQHNLNAKAIGTALELGGMLPVPSLAVTKATDNMLQFGDITLLAPPSIIEGEPVFDADGWTARFPTTKWRKVPLGGAKAVVEPFDAIYQELRALDLVWNRDRARGVTGPREVTVRSPGGVHLAVIQSMTGEGGTGADTLSPHYAARKLAESAAVKIAYVREKKAKSKKPPKKPWLPPLVQVPERFAFAANKEFAYGLLKMESDVRQAMDWKDTSAGATAARKRIAAFVDRRIREFALELTLPLGMEHMSESDVLQDHELRSTFEMQVEALVADLGYSDASGSLATIEFDKLEMLVDDARNVVIGKERRTIDERALQKAVAGDPVGGANALEAYTRRLAAYHEWVYRHVRKAFGKPQIHDGKRLVDRTLSNIVDAMTNRANQRAAEGPEFWGTLGVLRARMAKEFRTLEQVKAASSNLVPPKQHALAAASAQHWLSEAIDALKALNAGVSYRDEVFGRLILDVAKAAQDPSLDRVSKLMAKHGFLTTNYDADGMPAGWKAVPSTDATVKLVKKAALALRDIPVDYFEAKPLRAVGLGEFAGAVLPHDAPAEVATALRSYGLKVRKVTRKDAMVEGDNTARRNAVTKLAHDLDKEVDGGLLFSETPDPEAEKKKRGSYDPKSGTAYLLKDADLTTALHEMSHHYTAVLLTMAQRPGAAESTRRDAEILLDWWGIEPGKGLDDRLAAWSAMSIDEQRPHWETLAYNYEIYLFEGKAPSKELEGLFRIFSRWVRQVYRHARDVLNPLYRRKFNRDLPFLSDEVRGVFDRMLASEDAIAEMQAQHAARPMFEEQPEGMSDLDWAEYQLAGDEATETAVSELARRSLAVMKWFSNAKSRLLRQLQQQTRSIRKQVEEEERDRLRQAKVHAARERLRKGEVPRLSTDAVREVAAQFLPDVDLRRDLPGLTSPQGLAPDALAEQLGYASGLDLLRDLYTAPTLDEAVKAATDERMLKEHEELSKPEVLERKVEEVLHNQHRAKMVALELKFLSRGVTPVRTMTRAALAHARERIGQTRLREIQPHRMVQAEVRHRREAERALGKGEQRLAISYKRRELLAGQMTRAAIEARDEVDKAKKLFGKLWQTDSKLGKTRNVDYVALARAVVAMFDPQRVGTDASAHVADLQKYDPELYEHLAPLLERARSWAIEAQREGREIHDWRDLTMDEFRDMTDMVGALWNRSLREKQFEDEGKKVNLDAIAAKVVEADAENPKRAQLPNGVTSLWKTSTSKIHSLLLHAVRPEHWAWRKDGARSGVFTRYFWQRVRDAVNRYMVERTHYTKRVAQLVKDLRPSLKLGKIEFRDRDGNLLHLFGGRNGGFGQAELIAALLHTGNESSLRKLLVGRGWGVYDRDAEMLDTANWDRFVQEMENRGLITKEIWDFVQAVWDLNEELLPKAQKTHMDLLGFRFKAIEHREVVTRYGVYRGGYMPAKLDRDARSAGRLKNLQELEQDFRKQFATTGRGFTKGRVESFAEPLLLDLDLVPSHIDDVLRFVHIQPAVRDVQRLAMQPDVAATLEASQPGVWNKMLLPWLQRVASQSATKAGKSEDIDRVWRHLRSSSGMALMFANLTNVLQQTLSTLVAAVRVAPRFLAYGFWRTMTARRQVYDEIAQKSPGFMAPRQKNQIFDSVERINDLMQNKSKFAKFRAWSRQHAYFLQTAFQNWMDAVIWQGAYQQELERAGRDVDSDAAERQAVRAADAAIRMTQSSFDPTDVANYEEGTPFYKIFTQFSGWFNTMANLQADEFVRLGRETGMAKMGVAAQLYLLTFLVPMVGGELIAGLMRGHFDDDDDDGIAHEMFMESFFLGSLRSAAAEIPLAGQGINALIGWFDNKAWNDRMTSTPAISLLERGGGGTIRSIKDLFDPEKTFEGRHVRDPLTLLGVLTGTPAATLGKHLQAAIEGGGARALISGTLSERERNLAK